MRGAPSVRPARPGDREAFVGLVREAGLPLDGLASVAARFVAELDGEIVGVAALEQHTDDHGTAFLLRSVAVRDGRRRLGIGAALTRSALDHVDAHRAPVALLTDTAPDYFPRFAFVEVPRSALPSALSGSAELQGACAVSARAFLRQ